MIIRNCICILLIVFKLGYCNAAIAGDKEAQSVLDVLLSNRCNVECTSVSARLRTGLIVTSVDTEGPLTTDLVHTFFTMMYYVADEYFKDKAVVEVVSDDKSHDIELRVKPAFDGGFRCVGSNPNSGAGSVDAFVVFADPFEQHFDPRLKLAVNWCAGEFAKWAFGMSEEGQFLTPDWPLSDAGTKSYVSALLYVSNRGEVVVPDVVDIILRR